MANWFPHRENTQQQHQKQRKHRKHRTRETQSKGRTATAVERGERTPDLKERKGTFEREPGFPFGAGQPRRRPSDVRPHTRSVKRRPHRHRHRRDPPHHSVTPSASKLCNVLLQAPLPPQRCLDPFQVSIASLTSPSSALELLRPQSDPILLPEIVCLG